MRYLKLKNKHFNWYLWVNAQIGKKKATNSAYTTHQTEIEEHLTDFSLENGLTCLDTKFQKRKGKLWTYSNTNNAKARIYYILMNKKWINSALNCEADSSFEGVSSDHRIVIAKIHPNLCRNRTQTTKTIILLNNRDIGDKFTITQRNKFNAL